MKIIDSLVKVSELKQLADEQFGGELVKAVVDVEKKIMVIGGAMHADEEAMLLEHDSLQQNLWGINIRPSDQDLIEFDSMINIRPSQGNRSRSVEDEAVRKNIRSIVEGLINND